MLSNINLISFSARNGRSAKSGKLKLEHDLLVEKGVIQRGDFSKIKASRGKINQGLKILYNHLPKETKNEYKSYQAWQNAGLPDIVIPDDYEKVRIN